MDPHVSVQVALVTRSVVTHRAHEGLLPGVDLEVTVQERLPHEPLAAAGPGAGVALGVNLPGVGPHVRLPEEGQAAAGVGRGQSLVHGDHVPLEVVPPVCLVLALGVAAPERLVQALAVTVRGSQLCESTQLI